MNTAAQIEAECTGLRHQDIVSLPLGLLGFEQVKEYVWIQQEEETPFCWMQARRDLSLAFLVVPVFDVVPDYQPHLSDEDVEFLGLSAPSDALIYGIVTLRAEGRATVNLKGPIVVNRFSRVAKQVVLTNAPSYSLQHSLPAAA